MSEQLEERVRELEIEQAKSSVIIQNLLKVVEDNTRAITELTTVLNKGKGAAWAMAGAYTLFGGLIGIAIDFIMRK